MHRAATTLVIVLLSAAGATTAQHPALKALAPKGCLIGEPGRFDLGPADREDLTRSIVEPGARACA
jgi:hypothetical protein